MAIAATLMPPKRPRGARGGNPNRPSQRSRRDRGLPSELDSPAEGSTAERPPDPVGPPPGHHSGGGRWQLAWTWVPDQPGGSRPSVPLSSDRTGPVFTEEVRAYHHHGSEQHLPVARRGFQ